MNGNITEEPCAPCDPCADINDQTLQRYQPRCDSSSCHSIEDGEDPIQCKKEVPSGKALRRQNDSSMRNHVNSVDNKSYESDEGPIKNTRSWFRSKFDIFKIKNSVQNVLPSAIVVTRQDSSDNVTRTKFASIDQEKRTIIKNLLIVSIAFMLSSTALQSMSALHSRFGILRNTFGLSTVSI